MIEKIFKITNTVLEKTLGVRIFPPFPYKGLYGILKGPQKKPDPKEYSTIVGRGSIVPCQQETYFLVLNKYVSEKDKVLDVGFGLGYGLTILSIKAGEIYGVDVDQKVYDYCQESLAGKNPKLKKLSVYDGYTLDYPNAYFDVVTCMDVIEHVKNYDRLIREMLRVSKKGVFLNTPNRRPEYTNEDGTPKNYWHLREWSFEEFDAIIKKHGKPESNFINGPFDGPFTVSETLKDDTLALSPFLRKS